MGPTGTWQVVSVASSSTLAQHCFCEAQGLPKHRDQLQVQLLTEKVGWSQTPCFGYLLFLPPHTLSLSWSLTFNSCKKLGLQISEDILQCADLFHLCSPSLGLEIKARIQYSMKGTIVNLRCLRLQRNGKLGISFYTWSSLSTLVCT